MMAGETETLQIAAREYQGDIRLFEQHAGPWLDLCRQAENDEPFFRPEWIAAYVRAFEPRSSVLLVAAFRNDHMTAVLPLLRQKTLFCGLPVRMLRGAANEHSCRFDLIRAAGEDGQAGTKAVWELLKERGDWDVIELPYVPSGGAAEQLLRLADQDSFLTGQWESYRTPVIPLLSSDTSEAIPSDRHFQQNLRRRIRKAKANGTMRLRRIDDLNGIELEKFYQLERSGWKGRGHSAIACSVATQQFYNEVARSASQFGYFSLYLLEMNDAVVAGHFGLRYRGKYYSPKVAYDENYATYGPGHIIVDGILRDILSEGFNEFDFLGPWMKWKAEWARDSRAHSFCYIFRPGVVGHALYSMRLRLLKSLRPIIRLAHRKAAE
jgi:CelD/BcsL family acetyltransferase involved in cellulose biosynthesis